MSVITEDAVVLLTSSNTNNTKFGSGFIVAHDEQYSYVLSCAHVVSDVDDKPLITGLEAKEVSNGLKMSLGLDMALLKVAKLNKPCLNQFALGVPESDIVISGHSSFENGQVQRTLNGTLGKSIKITPENQSQGIAAFDVNIQDDDFSKLVGGYSGSPLCNQVGAVIGVVSHSRNAGVQGHALCISNLKTLYPDIEQLVPSFKVLAKNTRLTRIRSGLLVRMGEITAIYQTLFKRLTQIEKEADNDDNELILATCEFFLTKQIAADDFVTYCQNLTDTAPSPNKIGKYKRLAKELLNGNIALCLGLELPPSLKSKSTLLQQISILTDFNYAYQPALSEVCEYAELHDNCNRSELLSTLRETVTTVDSCAVYELLGKIDKPFLVIATGFDTTLAEYLQRHGRRFVTIVVDPNTQKEQERYQLNFANQRYETCSDDQLSAMQLMENGYTIIYYPRGYVQQDQDTLLLSESDYFNAHDLLNKRYPAYLHNKLKTRGLWFLGHYPNSWEDRLLALSLQYQRDHNREKPLVIQPQADTFSKLFWQGVGMNCDHDDTLSLDEFVKRLKKEMPQI